MNKYLDTLTGDDVRALYQRDDGPEIILGHVRHVVESFRSDPSTPGGRKAIVSLARKVSSLKTRLDGIRKEHLAGLKSEIKEVDERGKVIRDSLDEIRDEVRRPVTEFEQREKDRVEALKDRVAVFAWAESNALTMDLDELREYVATLQAIDTTTADWQEFSQEARDAKAQALPKVQALLDKAEQSERDRLELERLRKEQEEAQRQREIAAAAEAARVAAEKAALAKLEAERRRAEEEKLAAERKAEQERIKLDQEFKAALENEKRQREAAEAEARRAEEAKQAALEWAEANVKPSVPDTDTNYIPVRRGPLPSVGSAVDMGKADWQSQIREDILNAIICKSAQQIVDAIMAGEVPHVRVMS